MPLIDIKEDIEQKKLELEAQIKVYQEAVDNSTAELARLEEHTKDIVTAIEKARQ